MIFHHVYALVETMTGKIEEIKYFPTDNAAKIGAQKLSPTTVCVLCDEFDCQVGDYISNGRIYRLMPNGDYKHIERGISYVS